jgi:hypothetical protein
MAGSAGYPTMFAALVLQAIIEALRRHDALLVPAWCSFRCHDSRVAA